MQEQLKRGQKVKLDIVSKAMNSEFNVQPERMEPYWNARGVGINHWYHVQTVMDPAISKGELFVPKEKKFGNMPSGGKFEEQWGMHGWTTDQDHRTDPLARQKKQHKPNKVQTTKD